jgi:hypothetical protein
MTNPHELGECELAFAHYQAQQALAEAKRIEKELRDEIVTRALKGQTGKLTVPVSNDGWHMTVEVPPMCKITGKVQDLRIFRLSLEARSHLKESVSLSYAKYKNFDDADKMVLTESEHFAIVHGSPKVTYKKKD